MTKEEAIAEFKLDILPGVQKQYGKKDFIARCEAWNNWTDSLQKEGRITARQYNDWVNPF